jgi:hypothetical protein
VPPGSLLLVVAPVAVTNKAAFTWVRSWSAPFAYRPPFTNSDFTAHYRFVDARLVWCCQQTWASSVRNTVQEWASTPRRPPVALLVWDPDDSVLNRASDVTDPTLRTDVIALLDRPQATEADTCAWFRGLARRLVVTADPCNEVDPAFHETFYDRPH